MPTGKSKKPSTPTKHGEKLSIGRQVTYCKEDFIKLIDEYAYSVIGLNALCAKENNPARSTFERWINEHDDLRAYYTRAKEIHNDALLYGAINSAFNRANDYIVTDKGQIKVNIDNVLRSKLEADIQIKVALANAGRERNNAIKKMADSAGVKYLVEFADYKDEGN